MKKTINCVYLLIFCSTLLTSVASAQVRYTYTGNNFDTVAGAYATTMRITGQFIVPNTLPPNNATDISGQVTSFSFSDGIRTRTNSNSAVSEFWVRTDTTGNIFRWSIILRETPHPDIGDPQHYFITQSDSRFFFFRVNDSSGTYSSDGQNCCRLLSLPDDLIEFGFNSNRAGQWNNDISPHSIPTLSEWGLILMIVVLMLSIIIIKPKRLDNHYR